MELRSKNKLTKGKSVLFIVSTIIIVAGYSLEIITLSDQTQTLLANNIASISITLIASVLFAYNRKYIKISYTLIIYTALANVIYGTFANEFTELRLNFFLRDSLFIMIFLSLAALLIHKRHALIIALIYLVAAILITAVSGNFFMKNSIALIIVGVGGYGILIRYFVGILNSTIHELEDNSLIIQEQSIQLETKNDELIELNKKKDKFISILAHDLRNPFNTILGFSHLLMTKFDKLSDEKKNTYLQSIQITAEKTYELLNQLLDWAQSQAGNTVYNPERIALDSLLVENLDLLSESAGKKGITMKKNKDVDDCIFADKNMVNTIIRNLLSNAIKFTPEHGTITAGCYVKEDSVFIEIADTGVGMDEKDLKNLFDLDHTTSKKGTSNETGSGLGLLLCKDFADKCGGQISAQSELARGSIFTVSFPRVD
jgi:signal transduction histidine kinase